VQVKITEVDTDRRRISLSIKQANPDWKERAASDFSESRRPPRRPERREFEREDEAAEEPSFNADASLEAILEELKEKGIGRK
jgi:transcriptional accessory protein Tex/SPT6